MATTINVRCFYALYIHTFSNTQSSLLAFNWLFCKVFFFFSSWWKLMSCFQRTKKVTGKTSTFNAVLPELTKIKNNCLYMKMAHWFLLHWADRTHVFEAGHRCSQRRLLLQVGAPIKTSSRHYRTESTVESRSSRKLLNKMYRLRVCSVPSPSGPAGAGGALFTLFSTVAFFEGGFPWRKKHKERLSKVVSSSSFLRPLQRLKGDVAHLICSGEKSWVRSITAVKCENSDTFWLHFLICKEKTGCDCGKCLRAR